MALLDEELETSASEFSNCCKDKLPVAELDVESGAVGSELLEFMVDSEGDLD